MTVPATCQTTPEKGVGTSDTRSRLLAAARQLFFLRSYGSVSVDDLCAAADVRKGSFYHFFESKEALVLAMFEQDWQECKPTLDHVFDPNVSAIEQLRRLVHAIWEWQESDYAEMGQVTGCAWMNIGQEMCALNPQIKGQTQEFFDRYRKCHEVLLTRAQKDGLLPADAHIRTLASAMWASIMGVMCQARVQNSLQILRKELPAVLARFLTPPAIPVSDISTPSDKTS